MDFGKENDHISDEVHVVPIEPPSTKRNTVKEPLKLIFEMAFLIVVFVPMLIWSFIEYILAQPKSVVGKVVLVTGSGRGLGRGYAEEFARLGCKVACVDIDTGLNEKTVKEINEQYPGCNAKSYKCNVAIANEIHLLKKNVNRDFGQVDILVHNAGIVGGTVITDFSDIYLHGILNVNLTSHFLIIREFLPDMFERNEGHIVAVASMSAFNHIANASMYVATKHGVFGLMDCLHWELQRNPNNAIKTTVICPYFVNTSELYTKYWNLRFPELSIKEVVKPSVDGILKNRRIVTVPASLYYFSMFLKFLPDNILSLFNKIFYVEISLPPKKVLENTPLYQHLIKSAKDFELTVRSGST